MNMAICDVTVQFGNNALDEPTSCNFRAQEDGGDLFPCLRNNPRTSLKQLSKSPTENPPPPQMTPRPRLSSRNSQIWNRCRVHNALRKQLCMYVWIWPCHSSGGWSLTTHRGGPGTSPGQVMGFMVEKVAPGQVFSDYFGFPCQTSLHHLLHNHHHLSSGAGTIGQ
jgi:hypothetical protein